MGIHPARTPTCTYKHVQARSQPLHAELNTEQAHTAHPFPQQWEWPGTPGDCQVRQPTSRNMHAGGDSLTGGDGWAWPEQVRKVGPQAMHLLSAQNYTRAHAHTCHQVQICDHPGDFKIPVATALASVGVIWAPKGRQFHPELEHMPGRQARFPQAAAIHVWCCFHVGISLSLSLPFSVEINLKI